MARIIRKLWERPAPPEAEYALIRLAQRADLEALLREIAAGR